MKTLKPMCVAATILTVSGASHAALTANNNIDLSLPGVTQNNWTVDSNTDLLSVVILVELSTGTVFNPFNLVETMDGAGFLSPGDTFVTINGNPSTSLCGGAGALGDIGLPHPSPVFGPTVLSACWLSPGADTDDIGVDMPIGRFSFTEDAAGPWYLLVTNAGGDRDIISGVVVNGAMIPEPAALALLGLGGLALLQQRRR